MLNATLRRLRAFFTSGLLITAVSVTTTGGAATWTPPLAPPRIPPPHVQGKLPSAAKHSTNESKITEKALSAIGTPYDPTGAHPSTGFSSPGFTQWIYSTTAAPLPATAQGQWFMGNVVAADAVVPGVLVYAQAKTGVVIGPDLVVWASEASGEVIASDFSHFSPGALNFAAIEAR